MKNIVVVGGGTAGWLSALYFNKIIPDSNVTLIASEEVGILGAGEGSVNYFSAFLKNLDIDPFKVIEECNGTIKNGVKFINWIEKDKHFYHQFSYVPPLKHFTFDIRYDEASLIDKFLNLDSPLFSLDIGDLLMSQNKVLVTKNKRSGIYFSINTTNPQTNAFAFHFDAIQLAKTFKRIAIDRGVKYFDDFVKGFNQDKNGNVVEVICNNNTFNCDFIVDCTGFKRIVLGKLFNDEWNDVTKHLPADKAIPFFLPADKNLETYTTATAMDYGWTWKIPLQHRNGCGYVFSSSFCSEEQAEEEIITKYGDVEITKCFNFKSGYFKNPWTKNCLAIGLSGGFLEPLEATSIHTSMITLSYFLNEVEVMFNDDARTETARKNINKSVRLIYDNVVDFLQLHYLTKRTDTSFWAHMNNDSVLSEQLKYNIDILKYRSITEDEAHETRFNSYSWLRFAKVLGIIDEEQYIKRLKRIIYGKEEQYLKERKRLINILKYEMSNYKTQNEFIESYLKNEKMYK